MSINGVRDFKDEVTRLEVTATKESEQALKDQEQRFTSAIREITQSVTSLSRENDLVEVHGNNIEVEDTEKVVIDPNGFIERIAEFDKLIELLKMTHLEQETLDFFLRYTISSADLLQLKTTHDPQYVEMENSVKELEHNIEQAHHKWVDETKLQIFSSAEKLAKDQDIVNELYLETADILDDCDQLVKELEKLREEKEGRRQEAELQESPLTKAHEQWKEFRRSQKDYEHLEAQIAQLEMIKKNYELRKNTKEFKKDPKLNELGCTLDSLVRLWESIFLPNAGWHNLEVYPQTKKFQFDVLPIFTVVITLDDRPRICDIIIYRKQETGLRVDEDLQLELKQKNVGSRDIYKSMEHIVRHLQGLVPPK